MTKELPWNWPPAPPFAPVVVLADSTTPGQIPNGNTCGRRHCRYRRDVHGPTRVALSNLESLEWNKWNVLPIVILSRLDRELESFESVVDSLESASRGDCPLAADEMTTPGRPFRCSAHSVAVTQGKHICVRDSGVIFIDTEISNGLSGGFKRPRFRGFRWSPLAHP